MQWDAQEEEDGGKRQAVKDFERTGNVKQQCASDIV
jgi:hypothetical protein